LRGAWIETTGTKVMSEESKLTTERRIEGLLSQLASFDERIRTVEERQREIEKWCGRLYSVVEPIYKWFQKKKPDQEI
jgi:flagellar motility protein MotE (MotC chaperone)